MAMEQVHGSSFRIGKFLLIAIFFDSFLGTSANVVRSMSSLRGSDSDDGSDRTSVQEVMQTTAEGVVEGATKAEVPGLMPDVLLPTVDSLGLHNETGNEIVVQSGSAPWHEALQRELKFQGLPTISQIKSKLGAINDTLDQVDVLVGLLNSSVNDLVAQLVDGANKTMDTLEQIKDAADAAATFGGEEIANFISSFTLFMTMQVQDLQAKMLTMVQEQIYDRLDLVHTKFGEIKDDIRSRFEQIISTVLDMMKAAADRLPDADFEDPAASSDATSFLQASGGRLQPQAPTPEMAIQKLEELNETVVMVSHLLEGLNLTAVDMVVTGVVGAAKTNLEAIDSQCYGAVEGAGGAVPDVVKPMMQILCSAPLKLIGAMQPKIDEVISMVSAKVEQAITALTPLMEAISGLTALVEASQQV